LDACWRVLIDPVTNQLDGPDGGVSDWLPVLEDPASKGCLQQLAREAWNDHSLCCVCVEEGHFQHDKAWRVGSVIKKEDVWDFTITGATEVEAWVKALLNAPAAED